MVLCSLPMALFAYCRLCQNSPGMCRMRMLQWFVRLWCIRESTGGMMPLYVHVHHQCKCCCMAWKAAMQYCNT